MGYLDDYINNATKIRIKKPIVCIDKLLMLIRTNQFNPSDKLHVRWKQIGIKYGYIDSELNILKGEKYGR